MEKICAHIKQTKNQKRVWCGKPIFFPSDKVTFQRGDDKFQHRWERAPKPARMNNGLVHAVEKKEREVVSLTKSREREERETTPRHNGL